MDCVIWSTKVTILLILLAGTAAGRTRIPDPGHKIWDCKLINVNDLWLWNSNFGEFGQKSGDQPGGEWPGGSGHNYLFGGGIWVGCLIGTANIYYDTLVSVGYNPNTGQGEMVPGLISMGSNGYNDPDVRIYEYPNDWPPPENIFPMAPEKKISLKDQWCCFNDGDPDFHTPGDTRPIGFEVYMSVYGWTYYAYQDFIFYQWVIMNCSGDSLHRLYIGVCADPDIGAAPDEITGAS
ncbi:MAG TPA: hypothetical protein EYP58_02675 [bacterium (Candidatus Stahlbacteria)]|nr:hypothetical protein [Candidatus Stahlbacteria bacterium]